MKIPTSSSKMVGTMHDMREMLTSPTGEGNSTSPNAAAEAFTTGVGSSKAAAVVDEEDIEDEEPDLDALEQMFSKVNSAVAIEKEVAADTIGELFAATKQSFMPYVEQTVQVLIDLLEHYYEGLRTASVGALFAFIKTIYDMSDPTDWVPGSQVVGISHCRGSCAYAR